jgi:hypothetical protein
MSSLEPTSSALDVPAREVFVNAALARSAESRTNPNAAEEKANQEEKKVTNCQ